MPSLGELFQSEDKAVEASAPNTPTVAELHGHREVELSEGEDPRQAADVGRRFLGPVLGKVVERVNSPSPQWQQKLSRAGSATKVRKGMKKAFRMVYADDASQEESDLTEEEEIDYSTRTRERKGRRNRGQPTTAGDIADILGSGLEDVSDGMSDASALTREMSASTLRTDYSFSSMGSDRSFASSFGGGRRRKKKKGKGRSRGVTRIASNRSMKASSRDRSKSEKKSSRPRGSSKRGRAATKPPGKKEEEKEKERGKGKAVKKPKKGGAAAAAPAAVQGASDDVVPQLTLTVADHTSEEDGSAGDAESASASPTTDPDPPEPVSPVVPAKPALAGFLTIPGFIARRKKKREVTNQTATTSVLSVVQRSMLAVSALKSLRAQVERADTAEEPEPDEDAVMSEDHLAALEKFRGREQVMYNMLRGMRDQRHHLETKMKNVAGKAQDRAKILEDEMKTMKEHHDQVIQDYQDTIEVLKYQLVNLTSDGGSRDDEKAGGVTEREHQKRMEELKAQHRRQMLSLKLRITTLTEQVEQMEDEAAKALENSKMESPKTSKKKTEAELKKRDDEVLRLLFQLEQATKKQTELQDEIAELKKAVPKSTPKTTPAKEEKKAPTPDPKAATGEVRKLREKLEDNELQLRMVRYELEETQAKYSRSIEAQCSLADEVHNLREEASKRSMRSPTLSAQLKTDTRRTSRRVSSARRDQDTPRSSPGMSPTAGDGMVNRGMQAGGVPASENLDARLRDIDNALLTGLTGDAYKTVFEGKVVAECDDALRRRLRDITDGVKRLSMAHLKLRDRAQQDKSMLASLRAEMDAVRRTRGDGSRPQSQVSATRAGGRPTPSPDRISRSPSPVSKNVFTRMAQWEGQFQERWEKRRQQIRAQQSQWAGVQSSVGGDAGQASSGQKLNPLNAATEAMTGALLSYGGRGAGGAGQSIIPQLAKPGPAFGFGPLDRSPRGAATAATGSPVPHGGQSPRGIAAPGTGPVSHTAAGPVGGQLPTVPVPDTAIPTSGPVPDASVGPRGGHQPQLLPGHAAHPGPAFHSPRPFHPRTGLALSSSPKQQDAAAPPRPSRTLANFVLGSPGSADPSPRPPHQTSPRPAPQPSPAVPQLQRSPVVPAPAGPVLQHGMALLPLRGAESPRSERSEPEPRPEPEPRSEADAADVAEDTAAEPLTAPPLTTPPLPGTVAPAKPLPVGSAPEPRRAPSLHDDGRDPGSLPRTPLVFPVNPLPVASYGTRRSEHAAAAQPHQSGAARTSPSAPCSVPSVPASVPAVLPVGAHTCLADVLSVAGARPAPEHADEGAPRQRTESPPLVLPAVSPKANRRASALRLSMGEDSLEQGVLHVAALGTAAGETVPSPARRHSRAPRPDTRTSRRPSTRGQPSAEEVSTLAPQVLASSSRPLSRADPLAAQGLDRPAAASWTLKPKAAVKKAAPRPVRLPAALASPAAEATSSPRGAELHLGRSQGGARASAQLAIRHNSGSWKAAPPIPTGVSMAIHQDPAGMARQFAAHVGLTSRPLKGEPDHRRSSSIKLQSGFPALLGDP
eukprot:TRINITY_DN9160_c0_g3_i1.p1 TRINITY_DN9160_c0_g3~~TRINITY_DN9160_c0_g3_i1.p1  ORF type:complete len:1542 (+),score=474.26 TRINITY_DN9160_c0_g3_i1:72-4697(+)